MSNNDTVYRYKYPNESYSGCDMVANIVYSYDVEVNDSSTTTNGYIDGGNYIVSTGKGEYDPGSRVPITKTVYNTYALGELQTISYSIHMEKRPVRSIGNVNVKDYVMGPRTIAGSLVFAVFNRHVAKNIMADANNYFPEGKMFLVDELPPFNIVISFANEYGLRSKMVIYGVRLLNEGQVMSINDVYTENTYQFVATDIEYMNDEKTYSSGRDGVFHIIRDHYDTVDKVGLNTLAISKYLYQSYDPDNDRRDEITLNVSATDATRSNPKGKAVLSLSPVQTEGEITLTNTSNEVTTIKVTGAGNYSLPLDPDIYVARYSKPNKDKWKCNPKTFYIAAYKDQYDTKRYAPVIDAITNTSFLIYSNEPTHTHVAIKSQGETKYTYHKLSNRKIKINNLKANTIYQIATCTGENTLMSPIAKAKTLKSFEQPFDKFRRMIEMNTQLLRYKSDLNRYYQIIDEAQALAEKSKNFTSPTDYIVTLKKNYESELNKLDKTSPAYSDKFAEITSKIYACSELIYVSNKVQNAIIAVTNKTSNVPVPTHSYNEVYENIFHFDKEITKAEFYRMYKNLNQSAQNVSAAAFKTINKVENSFRYIGKSGLNHYVQALIDTARSPKLEFYEMTPAEKQEKILNDQEKNIISESDQERINIQTSEELNSLDSELLDRALIVKSKAIDNPIILDAEIISVNEENVQVKTNISNLTNNGDVYFYLCVANKEDIISNDFIYKHKFNCNDEIIELDELEYGLKPNCNYGLWIEDENFNQISNVSTFKMNEDSTTNDRTMFEYELSSIISDIKNRVSDILPTSIYESLCSTIEYNEEISKSNIIDITISTILNSGASSSVKLSALKAIKCYIGIIMESDEIIDNIQYNGTTLSYDAFKDSYSLIMEVDEEGVTYNIENDSVINTEMLNSNYALIVTLTPDLKFKSKIMFINLKTKQMEVL